MKLSVEEIWVQIGGDLLLGALTIDVDAVLVDANTAIGSLAVGVNFEEGVRWSRGKVDHADQGPGLGQAAR